MEEKKLTVKKKKYGGSSSVVSLRMPDKLVSKIDKVAGETGRTRNDLIIRFIDFALDNLVIEKETESEEDKD